MGRDLLRSKSSKVFIQNQSEKFIEQGFVPADKVLFFRQKDPKPFPPVRGPAGFLRLRTELYGSETRSTQTVLAG